MPGSYWDEPKFTALIRSAARDGATIHCRRKSAHASLALGNECESGARALGDDCLLERLAVIQEQRGNAAKKSDGDDERQRGGDHSGAEGRTGVVCSWKPRMLNIRSCPVLLGRTLRPARRFSP